MQFGLLYECQRPFKGTEIAWNTLYKETLAQCALADQVGFNNSGSSNTTSSRAFQARRVTTRSLAPSPHHQQLRMATASVSCPTITLCASPRAWPY